MAVLDMPRTNKQLDEI